jgi:hypothetical protein
MAERDERTGRVGPSATPAPEIADAPGAQTGNLQFPGFAYICGLSRRGRFQLQRKTRRDRMRVKLQEIKVEAAASNASVHPRAGILAEASTLADPISESCRIFSRRSGRSRPMGPFQEKWDRDPIRAWRAKAEARCRQAFGAFVEAEKRRKQRERWCIRNQPHFPQGLAMTGAGASAALLRSSE